MNRQDAVVASVIAYGMQDRTARAEAAFAFAAQLGQGRPRFDVAGFLRACLRQTEAWSWNLSGGGTIIEAVAEQPLSRNRS